MSCTRDKKLSPPQSLAIQNEEVQSPLKTTYQDNYNNQVFDDVLDVCQELPYVKIVDSAVNQVQVLPTPKMEKEECQHPIVATKTPNVGMVHVFLPSSVTFAFYMSQ